jgi:hypothetical protein
MLGAAHAAASLLHLKLPLRLHTWCTTTEHLHNEHGRTWFIPFSGCLCGVTVEGFSAKRASNHPECVFKLAKVGVGMLQELLQDSTMMNLAANHLEGTRVVLTIHSDTHHLHPQMLDADPQSK